jgi:PAS domain S-box-containing protein
MRVQESVRENEERYRLLFNEAHDAIFMSHLSPDGEFDRFIEANRVASGMLGYSPKELLGLTPYDITPPDEHEEARRNFQKFITDGRRLFERTLVRKDGRRIPVEISGNFFLYQSKPALICIARDISERKQAEQILKESEQKYKRLSLDFDALLHAIPDSLVLLSPDLKVLWANNAAGCECLRHASDPNDQHCYGSVPDRVICGQCPAPITLKTRTPENRLAIMQGHHIEMRAFPILDSGIVSRVLLAMTDVTEKVNLQAKAMQARHLASVGELAAGVAHEINNPVNGIMNYAQILINKSSGSDPGGELGRRILKESERIATIVRSLLSFARQNQNEKAPAQIRTIISESLVLAKVKLRKDNIQIANEIPEKLPSVIVNFQQIQQVVLNIINNSRYALSQKYPGFDHNKRIEIRGEEVTVNGARRVRISFLDCGTGIPAGNLSVVTEPFFSTKPKGHGLGLSTCYSIVNRHRGAIDVDSEPGKGSTFSFYLPASPDILLTDESLSTAMHQGAGTIIIMDDEKVMKIGRAHV